MLVNMHVLKLVKARTMTKGKLLAWKNNCELVHKTLVFDRSKISLHDFEHHQRRESTQWNNKRLINLIFKVREKDNLSNWDPITFLSMTYKVFKKVQQLQLQHLLMQIVDYDQTIILSLKFGWKHDKIDEKNKCLLLYYVTCI